MFLSIFGGFSVWRLSGTCKGRGRTTTVSDVHTCPVLCARTARVSMALSVATPAFVAENLWGDLAIEFSDRFAIFQ